MRTTGNILASVIVPPNGSSSPKSFETSSNTTAIARSNALSVSLFVEFLFSTISIPLEKIKPYDMKIP